MGWSVAIRDGRNVDEGSVEPPAVRPKLEGFTRIQVEEHHRTRASVEIILGLMDAEAFLSGTAAQLLSGELLPDVEVDRTRRPMLLDARFWQDMPGGPIDLAARPSLLETAHRLEDLRTLCEKLLAERPPGRTAQAPPWPAPSCLRTNERMRRLLERTGLRPPVQAPNAPALHGLMYARLVEHEGCLFLHPFLSAEGAAHLLPFPDATARECLVNHIVVDDWVDDAAQSEAELLRAGLSAAGALWKRLCERGERARVIVSHDGESCTLRFHRLRPSETWLGDDLESFPHDAILVLDTEPSGAGPECLSMLPQIRPVRRAAL